MIDVLIRNKIIFDLKIKIEKLSLQDLEKVQNFIIFNLENEKYQRSDKNFTDQWSTKLK